MAKQTINQFKIKNPLERANNLNLKLRTKNKNLKTKIQELEMKIKLQKIFCKLFHRQGQKFIPWLKSFYWKLYYSFKYKNENSKKNSRTLF